MKIVADIDLPLISELFSDYGDLLLLPGREIQNKDLTDADVLLVRSTTRVSRALIDNTALQFIGSATSGTDHIAIDDLTRAGIGFSDAKGCNANAVTDYCLSAIANIFDERIRAGESLKIGIIGHGAVGSSLAKKASSCNWDVLINDPPQSERNEALAQDISYKRLEQLSDCDVISIHVPLTTSGVHKTEHLIDKKFLLSLPKNSVLINTSRGGVVDEEFLLEFLSENQKFLSVVDVWVDEPNCNHRLVDKAYIATPHIAGYSQKAKKDASLRIYSEFCKWFSLNCRDTEGRDFKLKKLNTGKSDSNFLGAVNQVLPITSISSQFKKLMKGRADAESAAIFDRLRADHKGRHEFYEFAIPKHFTDEDTNLLKAAGFNPY